MKVKCIIFLDELYKNNLSPRKGQTVYKFTTNTVSTRIVKAIGSFTSNYSSINIEEHTQKFYGWGDYTSGIRFQYRKDNAAFCLWAENRFIIKYINL